MNKTILFLTAMLIAGHARAEFEHQADMTKPELTREQKEKIAWAIAVLIESQTLQAKKDTLAVQLDPTVVETLKKEGLLQISNSKEMSICVGPAR